MEPQTEPWTGRGKLCVLLSYEANGIRALEAWTALADFLGEQVMLRLRPVNRPDSGIHPRARGWLECPVHLPEQLVLVIRAMDGTEVAVLRMDPRTMSRVRRTAPNGRGDEQLEFDAGAFTCTITLLDTDRSE